MNGSPIASIRHENNLKQVLNVANNVILGHNFTVKQAQQPGKSLPGIDWEYTGKMFSNAVREDAAAYIKLHKMGMEDYQVDHVFEVQYFTAVFLHTIAEQVVANVHFAVEVPDIKFAVKIVNNETNLKSLAIASHKVKTSFFRAGTTEYAVPAGLSEYLVASAPTFQEAVQNFKAQDNIEHHRDFRTRLVDNVLSTPWCAQDVDEATQKWAPFLTGNKPFSQNTTLNDYILNWGDDNQYAKGS